VSSDIRRSERATTLRTSTTAPGTTKRPATYISHCQIRAGSTRRSVLSLQANEVIPTCTGKLHVLCGKLAFLHPMQPRRG
jgi:hypothetical protein